MVVRSGQWSGGVHVAAVAGIDHGDGGVEGGGLGRALPRGAHHHYIGVAGDHLDGVLQGLALGGGGGLGVGEANTVPPTRSMAVWKEKLVRVDGS